MGASPRDVLIDFLGALPTTIKENVLALCLMAFDAYPYGDPSLDLLALVPATLDARYPALAGHRCAMLSAVIEVALAEEAHSQGEFYTQMAKEDDAEIFAKMAAQAPLKERHSERARRQFAELRDGPLSPRALRAWSLRQMASDR
jgi:hypothetical protein